MKKKILGIAGSLRQQSINLDIINVISKNIRTDMTIELMPQSLLDLPLLNQDHQIASHYSEKITLASKMIADSDALLIASPEYNGSLTGALKNFIDFLSYGQKPFYRKKVGIVNVSPSPFGGIRGMMHLRDIMMHMGALVHPGTLCLSKGVDSYSDQQIATINEFTTSFAAFCL